MQLKEPIYLRNRKDRPIEAISVYEIPRKYLASHILEMAETLLARNVQDFEAFVHQSGELWQIYGRPELNEREFYIKWACQEALYETLGLTEHWPEAPAKDTVRAYAGIFWGEGFKNRKMKWNISRLNEFWRWWLVEGISTAWNLEN